MQTHTAVPDNSQIYYHGSYWNEFQPVLEYMCENFTGDKNKWWVQDFKERFCQKPFEHGLVLNCGNGWVEREFIDKGMVERVTAFDYSMDLLRVAEKEKGERPIFYFRTDVNIIDFGEDQFDLIINVASLHHVQYINRICRIMCAALTENGILVNFDYIGPHRNQYPLKQWFYINQVNRLLPDSVKKSPIIKPHLPTMVYSDPTEAIHSELIIESLSRYFEIFERHDTGGGIAYELLTHNPKLENVPADELDFHINRILMLDNEYTNLKRVPPLFSYFLAKPRKSVLLDERKLEQYQKEENLREEKARKRHGVYSISQYFFMIAHYLWGRLVRSGKNFWSALKNLLRLGDSMSNFDRLRNALGLQKTSLKSVIAEKLNIMPPVVLEEQWMVEPPNPPTREEAEAFIKAQGFWYHSIYLGNGIYTMPPTFANQLWALIKPTFPVDLKGASILDVGCNAGFFSILTKLQGAGRILGVESMDFFVEQAEYIREIWQMDIEYRLMDAHDIDEIDEQFDLVMFVGILYHLKNPLQVLEGIGRCCRDVVVVETEIIPEDPRNLVVARVGQPGKIKLTATTQGFMKFFERDELNGDVTNWWAPDTECLMGMLRVAGFKYFSATK